MGLNYFDLFGSEFFFHVENKKIRTKKSNFGGLITIFVIITGLSYFFYLLNLYLNNRIDPKFKTQTFISEDKVQIESDNENFAFIYVTSETQTLTQLENKTGLSYLQFIPALQVILPDLQTKYIMLDIYDCQTKSLHGYKCINFSKSEDYKQTINDLIDYNANLVMGVYKCNDTDNFKLYKPNNCAKEEDIDKILKDNNAYFQLKMKTSQFNTTSEEMEIRYKKNLINFQGNQMLYSVQKCMKQMTSVKKGPFIQYKQKFTSIIDYKKEERTFDRETIKNESGISALAQISITIDEQIQYVEIQYATFLEVLSIFNSTLAVLMSIGIISRYFSRKILYHQFECLFLQYFYTQSYFDMIKYNIIQDNNVEQNVKQKKKDKSNKQIQGIQQQLQLSQQNQIVKVKQQLIKSIDSKCQLSQSDDMSIVDENKIQSLHQTKFNLSQINQALKHSFKLSKIQSSQNEDSSFKINNNSKKILDDFNSTIKLNDKFKDMEQIIINQNNKQVINNNINDCDQRKKDETQKFINFKNILKLFQEKNQKKMDKIPDVKLKENKESDLQDNINILRDNLKKQLNIFQVMKDYLFIKKAIMVLLSEDQYAAINYIGCSLQKENKGNYIDYLNKTNKSQESQIKQMELFIERVTNQNIINDVDQRILSSFMF